MNDESTEQLERAKLRAEIQKLNSDVRTARGVQFRGWITALSVSAGIVVSAFQVVRTLSDIATKNRQLAIESQIRSHQLFLNQVLDRMSGIKTIHNKVDANGTLTMEGNEEFGDVTMVGSYGAAMALACEFEHLRFPAEVAFTFQLAAEKDDIGAATMLARLRDGCPEGWNRLTEGERQSWFERFEAER